MTITYAYDPLGRLAVMTDTSGVSFDFSYDPVGNRLSQEVVLCDGCQAQTTGYTYDFANRLSTVGVITYTWDANGNLLDDGVKTYGFDHANRLVSVADGQTTVTMAYNGLGDRISQTVNSVTTQYTLDLNSGLTQVLARDDGSRYVYGLGRLAQSGQGGAEYFLTDALGSVRQITDSSGEVTLAQTYQPFGEILSQAGEGESAYGYTGEWADNASELNYLRARWYAPSLGRFVSRDTWVGDPNQPLSYNAWLYSYANPVNYTDPSGYYPCSNCSLVPVGWYRDMCESHCDDCDNTGTLLPWRRDPEYNSNLDSIPNWGVAIGDDAKRIRNAGKVWDWICETGGPWGAYGCPPDKHLATWLLSNVTVVQSKAIR